jgi:serine/threonine protein kinase
MTPSNLEGTNLGKYRIVQALGRGGMAQVYKAYHPQLDRYVAVKVLRSDLVEEQGFLERFKREAHAVAGLRHTNIVQVFDFDSENEMYYMVMELLEGDTLRARLNERRKSGERLPLSEVVQITSDTLDGLAYAHSEGVIHRDIKPANIMLTQKGQAVLTDFGIAQIVGGTHYTASGALMGTLHYMAPEQGFKGESDQRSDIYSLGIVLYEMLTGHPPFDADTPLAILMKHLNDPLPLPAKMDTSIPAALETIVLRALAKNPEDRFQRAEDMLAALQNIAADLPTTVRPIGGQVYSGVAREQIGDMGFADDDTDAISAPQTATNFASAPVSPLNGLLTSLTETLAKLPIFDISTTSGIFGGIGLFVLINGALTMAGTLSGKNILPYTWPLQILLIANLMSSIGWGTRTHWFIIPTGMLFGIGSLLTYSTLSGRWGDWAFLWAFALVFGFFSVAAPIKLNEIPGASPVWARVVGVKMILVTLIISGIVLWASLLVGQ